LQLNARIGATVPQTDGSESVPLQAPGQLDQRQLLSMLTGSAGSPRPAPSSAAATAVAPSASATGGISAANLSAILAGIGRGAGAGVQVIRFFTEILRAAKNLTKYNLGSSPIAWVERTYTGGTFAVGRAGTPGFVRGPCQFEP
jgi:hypothetical protein